MSSDFRTAIREYIRQHARPVEKYGHQPRLYALTKKIGTGFSYDDDVVFAAAWLHDLGVFIGQRPEDPAALSQWDNVAYAVNEVPALLAEFGFPGDKISAVAEAIRTHQPAAEPTSIEGTILRDADILEQLGAIAVLRTVAKIGRDTRFSSFQDAVTWLQKALHALPSQIRLETTRELALPKIEALRFFLEAVEREGVPDVY